MIPGRVTGRGYVPRIEQHDHARSFAEELLAGMAGAIGEELDRHGSAAPGGDPRAYRVAIYEAITAVAGERAAEGATQAREQGVSWRVLSEALGRSISAVRHRYDPSTIDSRRKADRRRRGG